MKKQRSIPSRYPKNRKKRTDRTKLTDRTKHADRKNTAETRKAKRISRKDKKKALRAVTDYRVSERTAIYRLRDGGDLLYRETLPVLSRSPADGKTSAQSAKGETFAVTGEGALRFAEVYRALSEEARAGLCAFLREKKPVGLAKATVTFRTEVKNGVLCVTRQARTEIGRTLLSDEEFIDRFSLPDCFLLG